jgi:hypothetical protein
VVIGLEFEEFVFQVSEKRLELGPLLLEASSQLLKLDRKVLVLFGQGVVLYLSAQDLAIKVGDLSAQLCYEELIGIIGLGQRELVLQVLNPSVFLLHLQFPSLFLNLEILRDLLEFYKLAFQDHDLLVPLLALLTGLPRFLNLDDFDSWRRARRRRKDPELGLGHLCDGQGGNGQSRSDCVLQDRDGYGRRYSRLG